jgi:very-short-patch-repair endonuclease
MTLPEVVLWQLLRARPAGFKFRRQYPVGGYVADFACISAQLLIEVDGAAHDCDGQPRIDALRQHDLEANGFSMLRIAARDVLKDADAVVRMIIADCEARTPLHRPAAGPPPLSGEEL